MDVRNCLRSEKTMEIFYMTEKSNCSEVVALFFSRCGLLTEALSYHEWIHNYRWQIYLPSHPTFLNDLNANSPYRKIKFVRCPYDRAVSCYFQYCKSPSINHYSAHPSQTITKRVPNVIVSDLRQKPPTELSFLDFLRLLKRLFPTMNRTPASISPNSHIATQSLPQEQSRQIVWDHVIHVENMTNELALIGIHDLSTVQSYKNHLKTNHWNKSPSFIQHQPESLATIPFHKIKQKHVNYVDFYNEECKLLVERLYQLDFQCHPEYTWKEFLRRNNQGNN